MRSPGAVPPGSRTGTTSRPPAAAASARSAAWVVLPHPSRPSKEMNTPEMLPTGEPSGPERAYPVPGTDAHAGASSATSRSRASIHDS